MSWQGLAVKELRQRLGWSRAELARRLSISLDEVSVWEEQNRPPAQDVSTHLFSLRRHVDSQSENTVLMPRAEAVMKRLQLSQIHDDQVEAEWGPEMTP